MILRDELVSMRAKTTQAQRQKRGWSSVASDGDKDGRRKSNAEASRSLSKRCRTTEGCSSSRLSLGCVGFKVEMPKTVEMVEARGRGREQRAGVTMIAIGGLWLQESL